MTKWQSHIVRAAIFDDKRCATSVTNQNAEKLSVSKEVLSDSLDRLLEIASDRNSAKLISQCSKLQQKMQDFSFNLLILGEFKRGKSTLINALLGVNVLPTATIPLTSVVTVMVHGENPSIEVMFQDGTVKNDLLGNLSNYVTERENPKNERGVATVKVFYPAPLLDSGICIIDTPGTGSVFTHNTQTTLDFLPEADAAVFVFAADQPATQDELELLQMAKQFSVQEFFVLNKVDYLDDQGKNESLNFLKNVIDERLDQDCRIYPLSSKAALERKLNSLPSTGDFLEFETALVEFFRAGKNKALLESMHLKILALLNELSDLLALEAAALAMTPEKLSHALEQFHSASAALLDEQTDAKYIIGGEIKRLVKTIETDLQLVVDLQEDGLESTIECEFEEHSALPKDLLIDTLRKALVAHISAILGDWVKVEDKRIGERFETLNARFTDKANETIIAIEKVTQRLFDVKVTRHFDIQTLTNKSKHFYAVCHPFSLALEMAPLLLPNFLAKRIIRRKFLIAAHHELARNAGRLRADYQERIEYSAHEFLQNFHERVVDALAEVESVVMKASEMRKNSVDELLAAESRLSEQKLAVIAIQESLAGRDPILS
jgi:small GTP-binding protein